MSLKKLYDYRRHSKQMATDTVPFTVPRLLNYSRQSRTSGRESNSTLPPLPISARASSSSSGPSCRCNSEPHMINLAQLTESSESRDGIKSSTDSLVFGINPCLYEVNNVVDVETSFEKGNIGRLWFSVQYNPETERLVVKLIQIKNLRSRIPGTPNACDPFVKIGLFPVERRNLQSSVKKKTCSPNFQETFVFQLSLADFRHRSVKFSVYDANRGKHHVIIGYVIYPLKLYESYSKVVLWRDLENDESSAQAIEGVEASLLYISLCYNSALNSLTVEVHGGKNFSDIDEDSKKTELYVVVSLARVNQLLKSKKSNRIGHSTEPAFNEVFKLKLPFKLINSVSLSVSVFTREESSKDRLLGLVVLGSLMFARGQELEHWQEMLSREKELVGRWHHLI